MLGRLWPLGELRIWDPARDLQHPWLNEVWAATTKRPSPASLPWDQMPSGFRNVEGLRISLFAEERIG